MRFVLVVLKNVHVFCGRVWMPSLCTPLALLRFPSEISPYTYVNVCCAWTPEVSWRRRLVQQNSRTSRRRRPEGTNLCDTYWETVSTLCPVLAQQKRGYSKSMLKISFPPPLHNVMHKWQYRQCRSYIRTQSELEHRRRPANLIRIKNAASGRR